MALAVISSLRSAPAEAQTTRFMAFGDSLTVGFGDPGVPCVGPGPTGGWTTRLRQRMNSDGLDVAVENFGLCGERTQAGLSRIDNVIARGGDIVVVYEGTNDLSSPSLSVEGIRSRLWQMVDKVLDAGQVPILVAPPPRRSGGTAENRTAFLSFTLEQDAAERGVLFVDLYDGLLAIPNLFNFYFDDLHTDGRGYDFATDVFEGPAREARRQVTLPPVPCAPDELTLCLNEGRFSVRVAWRDFEGNTGDGQAVPRTDDSGFFYFFEEENLELLIKVLDGREFNDAYWVFYGALSDVQYEITVVDTFVGPRRTYFNPEGNLASVGDTVAFPNQSQIAGLIGGSDSAVASAVPALGSTEASGAFATDAVPLPFSSVDAGAPTLQQLAKMETCVADDTTLCLGEGRFAVEVEWEDFDGNTGVGRTVPQTTDTGSFWFFDPQNLELVLKVLDGRGVNGHYWVFYGALSNVSYSVRVTDSVTGESAVYDNPIGEFGSESDVEAFLETEDES